MLKGFKYRIYPNKKQRELLSQHFGCTRWVYNWGLEQRIKSYELTGKSPSRYDLQALLPLLKKQEETKWLAGVHAANLQSTLTCLDTAFKRFFDGISDFPKFKKKFDKQSTIFPSNNKIYWNDNKIIVTKHLKLKAVFDRKFIGTLKSVTISRNKAGKYFASCLVDDGVPIPQKNKFTEQTTVGVDLGLTHYATLSTGEKIENPRKLRWSQKKLAHLQRKFSKTKKGSNRRNKARLKVARCYERISNQRKDFLHKLSTRLIRENQAIAIEDLNVSGMMANHKLAKSIQDASWGTFVGMLKYKAEWYGKTILQIGRFQPSSKICSCGVVHSALTLADRTWQCESCGVSHDRDILADRSKVRRSTPDLKLVENLEYRGDSMNRELALTSTIS
jgi:putative transposase